MRIQSFIHHHKVAIAGITAGVLILGLGIVRGNKPILNHNSETPASSSQTGSPNDLPFNPRNITQKKASIIHTGLEQSSNPQLALLSEHERRLGRNFNSNMLFSDMPATVLEAQQEAPGAAAVLKDYAMWEIKPLMVFEPEGLDLKTIDREVFEAYFKALKAQGVTDKQMGTWILFPEPNIPAWGFAQDKGNTDPALFVKNFTKAATALKTTFPAAEVAVLLDSATYPSHDVDYALGSYDKSKLLQYVSGFRPGLVDAIGLQGFPWGEKGGEANYDPATFLDADLAIAIAKHLDVKDVWLNSGTFGSMHDWDPQRRVVVSSAQRGQILNGIVTQADKVQKAGFNVTVNIFAEDKSTTEANWSYADSASWEIFRGFVDKVESKGIGLALFDT